MSEGGFLSLYLYPHTTRRVATYKITIRAKSELLVGGGSLEQATTPFDIPAAKMPWGDSFIPYIPGSTVKGFLRAAVEEYLRARAREENLSAPLAEVLKNIEGEMIDDELVEKVVVKLLQQFVSSDVVSTREIRNASGRTLYEKTVKAYKNAKVDVGRLLEEIHVTPYACAAVVEGLACELPIRPYKLAYLRAMHDAIRQRNDLNHLPYPCPVCLTFGAAGYSSNVVVTSAYPRGELGKDYFILTRRHVAIDRYTGAAAEGKLFEVEYVTAGAEFVGYLILLGDAQQQLTYPELEKLLRLQQTSAPQSYAPQCLITLLQGTRSAMLGRRKSAGMGEVEVTIEEIREDQCDSYPPPLKEICRWATT